MTKAELINIGQDLILKAGLLKKPTETQKKSFLKLLHTYEGQIKHEQSKYAHVIQGFMSDIRNDIEQGREINIDNIDNDEWVENYFITKHEVDIFNQLIHTESYNIIFQELISPDYSQDNIHAAVLNIDAHFRKNFKKLSIKNISKNLLIFSVFERNLPLPALNRLVIFLLKHEEFSEEAILIRRLESLYKTFLKTVYNESLQCIKHNAIEYKYIRYIRHEKSGVLSLALTSEDASKYGFRTGDPQYEYVELLKRMA